MYSLILPCHQNVSCMSYTVLVYRIQYHHGILTESTKNGREREDILPALKLEKKCDKQIRASEARREEGKNTQIDLEP